MPSNRILIVDDSYTIRFQLKRILTHAGYEVITASNGYRAIEILKQRNPDLLILDINMPELDGYGVCERINQLLAGTDRLPVVFVTSLNSRALELLGHEFGAYLQKPVREADLLSVVEQQLEQVNIS